jgi:predicted DNA-binding antitoxin AbrB/MazE fold protein
MEQALEQTDLTEGEKLKVIEEYNAKIREIDKATADNKKKLDQEAIDRQIETPAQLNRRFLKQMYQI